MRRATPTFGGQHAVVLHRPDEGIERLLRQLQRLGLTVETRWSPLRSSEGVDLVFVDADQGFDELLPWRDAESPVPVIGLLQTEAPGRIAWMLKRGAVATIPKPVQTAAIYPAMIVAAALHAERREARARLAQLEERLRMRPIVHEAIRIVALAHGCDEEAAYRHLRDTAMQNRRPLEQIAAAVAASGQALPEAG